MKTPTQPLFPLLPTAANYYHGKSFPKKPYEGDRFYSTNSGYTYLREQGTWIVVGKPTP